MKKARNIARRLLMTIIVAVVAFTVAAQDRQPVRTPYWEVIQLVDPAGRPDSGRDIADVTVSDGKVTIVVERSVTVRVFSILGQLITQKQLAPGRHRLTLATKGIYILKAGADTRRISI